jgi:hypothetical protein
MFAPRVADLVAEVGPVEGIGIDIPMGLLGQGHRTADAAAAGTNREARAFSFLNTGQVSA